MLDIIIAILYGAVQGITEFLPISSSGHLVVLHEVFVLPLTDEVAFDVVLHLGSLVALLGFFYSDIIKYLRAFVRSFFDWQVATDSSERLSWFLFIGTIPAALAGYFFGKGKVSHPLLREILDIKGSKSAETAGQHDKSRT